MDVGIQKALHDKLYEKRKAGALELEKLVRDTLAAQNHDRIRKIVHQLCHDYTYAVHQPYARNGGLIGLAAASIALGPEVAEHLEEIVPPVLSCFADQDARVRYYACESMYNISKTSKGEILPFFNEVFDALAKLAADSELSVKNGAELLDRLIKDIVSESAASYVSVVHPPNRPTEDRVAIESKLPPNQQHTAFSLSRFIPLLQERILVLNPFTRMFLVQWITLLDSIPDLALISYLPSFLSGLFRFLNDSNQDVVTSTQHVLERFLDEIKLVARVRKDMADTRKLTSAAQARPAASEFETAPKEENRPHSATMSERAANSPTRNPSVSGDDTENSSDSESDLSLHDGSKSGDGDWIPGQDVYVNHPRILAILLEFLRDNSEHVQLTALRWIDSFFGICPDDIMLFVPRLLNQVLPALSSEVEQVRKAGARVNASLVDYIMTITDVEEKDTSDHDDGGASAAEHGKGNFATMSLRPASQGSGLPPTPGGMDDLMRHQSLDYDASIEALTTQFLNENEATRAASLSWLIMLQRKAPKKVLAAHDGTFPALLRTLSDTSDTVVTRDLQLLCQISRNSDDAYFSFFMINLLKLFRSDRRLLEARGNLIIRQLCLNLSPEKIYRTMSDCLEQESDSDFASTMVQNLNNNLITAPELGDLRKKLRTWDQKDGQTLFVVLFRAWCHNAIATISLCLLAQAYEHAYNLIQVFADIEMTVNMLIQIDKLVQLLESPVFTYLRLQLLEPDRYPSLYKVLYGILMLLPQSAAFAALKNRLNSVSAIGYLHIPQPRGGISSSASSTTPSSTPIVPGFERPPGRLKSREEGGIKWSELLEAFRRKQDQSRHGNLQTSPTELEQHEGSGTALTNNSDGAAARRLMPPPALLGESRRQSSPTVGVGTGSDGGRLPVSGGAGSTVSPMGTPTTSTAPGREHKSRFGAGHFGKLANAAKGKSKK